MEDRAETPTPITIGIPRLAQLLERHGYRTPIKAREHLLAQAMA